MERISCSSENGDFSKLRNLSFSQLTNFENNDRRTLGIFQTRKSTILAGIAFYAFYSAFMTGKKQLALMMIGEKVILGGVGRGFYSPPNLTQKEK